MEAWRHVELTVTNRPCGLSPWPWWAMEGAAKKRRYNRHASSFVTGLWGSWGIPESSMPDGHSRAVPPLPIPNRTVKRPCADDSAATGVKVGHCQATHIKAPHHPMRGFCFLYTPEIGIPYKGIL